MANGNSPNKVLPDHLFSGSRNPNQPDHLTGGVKHTGASTSPTTTPPAAGQPQSFNFNTQPGAGSNAGIPLTEFNNLQSEGEANIAAVIAQMQAAGDAQAAAATAGMGGIAAQRQAALYGQKAGLRDIGQQTEAGVEQATGNALQRGIYDSGVRQEGQLTAIREGAEAEADLRAQTAFRLQGLAAQAAQMRANAAAIRAGTQAQVTQTGYGMNRDLTSQMQNLMLQFGISQDDIAQFMGWIQQRAPSPGSGGARVE